MKIVLLSHSSHITNCLCHKVTTDANGKDKIQKVGKGSAPLLKAEK